MAVRRFTQEFVYVLVIMIRFRQQRVGDSPIITNVDRKTASSETNRVGLSQGSLSRNSIHTGTRSRLGTRAAVTRRTMRCRLQCGVAGQRVASPIVPTRRDGEVHRGPVWSSSPGMDLTHAPRPRTAAWVALRRLTPRPLWSPARRRGAYIRRRIIPYRRG